MLDSTLSNSAAGETLAAIEKTSFADAQNVIAELRPIHRLPAEAISSLAKLTENLSVPAGQTISELVRDSAYVHYLVEGTLVLLDSNNNKKPLNAGDTGCKTAIDRRINGSVDLIAETNCFLARLPWSDLESFLLQYAPDELSSSTLEVKEILTSTCSDWMVRLLQSELISMLPAANIQEVLASIEVLQISPEEVVINQGDAPDHFYIIEAGKFSVFRDIESTGRQVELANLTTGDFFGEEALITGDKRGTSVKATTAAKLLKVNGGQFKKSIVEPAIVRENPDDTHEHLKAGAKLIDVRTSEQFKQGHLPDSINLVLQLLRINSNQLDKGQKYVVGAEHINAAAVATFLLRVRGFDVTCMDHSIGDYAEKFGIELVAVGLKENPRPVLEENIETPNVQKPAGVKSSDKPTFEQISKLAAEHASRDEQPAPAEDYANTVTGVGLADLIEELNDSYETEVELSPIIAQPEEELPHLNEVQAQLSVDTDFNVNAADTIEKLEKASSDPTPTIAAKEDEIKAEVAKQVALATKELRLKFEQDLKAGVAKNKKAALQALHAHKQKLDLQFRAKQKTLLANSQKLIALANKISQQKAEVEEARKALASAKNSNA